MSSYDDFRPSLRFQPMLTLSPDGKFLAYADDASGQFNLKIQPLAGGPARQLTSYSDHTLRRAAWHPDGKSLVFQADRQGDESAQIYLVTDGDDSPRPITDRPGTWYWLAAGDPFDARGRRLAYVGNDRVPRDQDILVHHLDDDQVQRIYTNGGQVYVGTWSPDGRRLTMAKYRDGYDHDVFVLSADGTGSHCLTSTEEVAAYWLGPWLPEGDSFLVRTNVGREFVGLALLNADTGDRTWLDTPEWDVESVALSGDGKVLVWIVNVDGASQLRARDLGTGQDISIPELPLGQAECLTISRDGSFALMLLSTATRPRNIALVDLQTGELRWLTGATTAAMSSASTQLAMVEPVLVHYQASDGLRVPGYLYTPTEHSAKVGVVISIHGGPVQQERPHNGFRSASPSHSGPASFPDSYRHRDPTGHLSAFQRVYQKFGSRAHLVIEVG